MRRPLLSLILSAYAALTITAQASAGPDIAWQNRWGDDLFVQTTREHRFVILDLHAVWCHWCHVMDEKTYSDPTVQSLIAKNYVAVSIDADSDPDLSSRYGDWGWPATIVLAADGSEIVKRRGYIPPAQMESLLRAIIDDPSPGPSVGSAIRIAGNGGRTQDANLHLIDPVWGGVYQYSDEVNWLSPHFEKLMSFQADDLRLYSEAYARWP